ncbi:MAG: metallo-beta-lactamase, partial [Sphingomonadales bacterium]
MLKAFALALIFGMAAPAQAQDDWVKIRKEWNQPVAPFTIVGNVHYVGTAGIAAYLITTPEGHILIDGAMEESAGQVEANIEALGYKLADVKILLVNHAHWDHSGGLAELKRRTGARLFSSTGDKAGLEAGRLDYRPDLAAAPSVKVDGLIRDGEKIRLGGTVLTTHLTPGHTKGCTS